MTSPFLDNIECQIQHCGADFPLVDGDCCAGFNDSGKCVKGKWNADRAVCVVKKGLSTETILWFTGIVLLILIAIWVIWRLTLRKS